MIAILVSIIAGGLIVFTRIFNFKMADKMGLFQGASINYIAGLLFSIILALFLKSDLTPSFQGIPTWAYLGGLFGVGVIVLSSYLTKRVSSFYLTLLIFLGQLATGMVIDYFISGDVPLSKIIGGVLVVIGFSYNLVVDSKPDHESYSKAA
ncbi:DMT family transporter [Acidaminobacter sp. JC074]|nr:DMT family transporter [Acidaminobacter sp. JC074]